MTGRSPSGRATLATHQAPAGLGHSEGVPNAVRRTISPFERAPRDGTPFHTLTIVRFNPLMERFEGLSRPDWQWLPLNFGANEPTVFCRLVPLPYELPMTQWFPVEYVATYLCRRKTRIERFRDWLLNKFPTLKMLMGIQASTWRFAASRIEARSAGTGNTDPARKGESLTAKGGDAQTSQPSNGDEE